MVKWEYLRIRLYMIRWKSLMDVKDDGWTKRRMDVLEAQAHYKYQGVMFLMGGLQVKEFSVWLEALENGVE